MSDRSVFPFSAVVGSDDMALALVLTTVSPGVSGVLVCGEKGTAKSTMVRGLAAVMPEQANSAEHDGHATNESGHSTEPHGHSTGGVVEWPPSNTRASPAGDPGWLLDGWPDGLSLDPARTGRATVHASYLHTHWAEHPQLAARFAEAVHEFARSGPSIAAQTVAEHEQDAP